MSPKSGFWLSSNPIHIRFSKYKHHIIKIAPFLDSSSKNELVLKNGQNKRQIFKKNNGYNYLHTSLMVDRHRYIKTEVLLMTRQVT